MQNSNKLIIFVMILLSLFTLVNAAQGDTFTISGAISEIVSTNPSFGGIISSIFSSTPSKADTEAAIAKIDADASTVQTADNQVQGTVQQSGKKNEVLSEILDVLEHMRSATGSVQGTTNFIKEAVGLKKRALAANFSPNDDISKQIASRSELQGVTIKTIGDADKTIRDVLTKFINTNKVALQNDKSLDLTIANSPILYNGFSLGRITIWAIIIALVLIFFLYIYLVSRAKIPGWYGFLFKTKRSFPGWAWIKQKWVSSTKPTIKTLFYSKQKLLKKNKDMFDEVIPRLEKDYANLRFEEIQDKEHKWLVETAEKIKNINGEIIKAIEKYENFLGKFQGAFKMRFAESLIQDRNDFDKIKESMFPKTGETFREVSDEKISEARARISEYADKAKGMLNAEQYFVNTVLYPEANELANAIHNIRVAVNAEEAIVKQEIEILSALININKKDMSPQKITDSVNVLRKLVNNKDEIRKKEETLIISLDEIEKKFDVDLEKASNDEIASLRKIEITKKTSETVKAHFNKIPQNSLNVGSLKIETIQELRDEISHSEIISDDALAELIKPTKGQIEKEGERFTGFKSPISDWVAKEYDNKRLEAEIDKVTRVYLQDKSSRNAAKDARKRLQYLLEDAYPRLKN